MPASHRSWSPRWRAKLGDLRMGKDEEALLAQALERRFGDLLGLEHLARGADDAPPRAPSPPAAACRRPAGTGSSPYAADRRR